MLLSAIVKQSELALVLESLLPLRVVLDAERGRSVTFERADVELVRGRGIRLRGDARVAWDVAGVAIPIRVDAWQVLLEPRIGAVVAGRTHVLALAPVLERLELRSCPGLIEGRIAEALDRGIGRARDRLAWDFARTLSRRFFLPERVDPARALDIAVVGGACAVTDDELALRVELTARVPAEPGKLEDVAPPKPRADRADARAVRGQIG
jgi:hypothetical protein